MSLKHAIPINNTVDHPLRDIEAVTDGRINRDVLPLRSASNEDKR